MKRKTGLILCLLAVLLVAAIAIFTFTRPKTSTDSKKITVTVIFEDGSTNVHEVETDGEYLIDAVKEFTTGEDSAYGFFITGVDGVEADAAAEQWWCINDCNGEMLMTGVSDTPIKDGDAFQLVLMTGYDY